MDHTISEILSYGIKISVVGFSIVFIALIVVAFVVKLLQNVDNWLKPKSTKSPSKQKASDEGDEGEMSPELIAAISAAVAVAIDTRHKITRIRYRAEPGQSSWSVAGRTSILASHNIRRRK